MKKTLFTVGFVALMSTTALADGIGVSMAAFDDNFLTVLRNGIQTQADAAGLSVQIEFFSTISNRFLSAITLSRRCCQRSSSLCAPGCSRRA